MADFSRKNRGKFHVDAHFFTETDFIELLAVFKELDFIPTKVDFLYAENKFEYIGFSPNFEEVPEGCHCPVYNVEVTLQMNPETGENYMASRFTKAYG